MATTEMKRGFRMGSVELPDPDPRLSPEDVKKAYAVNYSHLETADIEGPTHEGDTLVYTFRPAPAKSKG